MITQKAHQTITNIRENLPSASDALLLLSVLGVVGFNGLKRLQVPESLGFEYGVITAVEIENRVGVSGYNIAAQLPNGDVIHVNSPYFNSGQTIGERICIHHIRDQVRNRDGYKLGMPFQCRPQEGGFLSRWV